ASGLVPEEQWTPPPVLLAVDLVILTLRNSRLHVLLVERGVEPYRGARALPGGFLNNSDEGLEEAAHRELREEAGLDASQLHLEQIAAYGEPGRDPRGRIVSVARFAMAPSLPEPAACTDAVCGGWAPVEHVVCRGIEVAFGHSDIVVDGVGRVLQELA